MLCKKENHQLYSAKISVTANISEQVIPMRSDVTTRTNQNFFTFYFSYEYIIISQCRVNTAQHTKKRRKSDARLKNACINDNRALAAVLSHLVFPLVLVCKTFVLAHA